MSLWVFNCSIVIYEPYSINNNVEKVRAQNQQNHNDNILKFGLIWHHFLQFCSDFNTLRCTFWANPLSRLKKSVMCTTKLRQITELFSNLAKVKNCAIIHQALQDCHNTILGLIWIKLPSGGLKGVSTAIAAISTQRTLISNLKEP